MERQRARSALAGAEGGLPGQRATTLAHTARTRRPSPLLPRRALLHKATLAASGGALPLPMIKNKKTVNPRDGSSTAVFQLETAMGSAIECFDGAAAVVVPRSRFAPVKTTRCVGGRCDARAHPCACVSGIMRRRGAHPTCRRPHAPPLQRPLPAALGCVRDHARRDGGGGRAQCARMRARACVRVL